MTTEKIVALQSKKAALIKTFSKLKADKETAYNIFVSAQIAYIKAKDEELQAKYLWEKTDREEKIMIHETKKLLPPKIKGKKPAVSAEAVALKALKNLTPEQREAILNALK